MSWSVKNDYHIRPNIKAHFEYYFLKILEYLLEMLEIQIGNTEDNLFLVIYYLTLYPNFENIMENGTFALLEQMLHFP